MPLKKSFLLCVLSITPTILFAGGIKGPIITWEFVAFLIVLFIVTPIAWLLSIFLALKGHKNDDKYKIVVAVLLSIFCFMFFLFSGMMDNIYKSELIALLLVLSVPLILSIGCFLHLLLRIPQIVDDEENI